MAWDLAAPAAVDALLALAESIPDIDVADGQKVSGSGKTLALVIGFSDAQHAAVEHTVDEPAFTENQEDRFTVYCRAEATVDTAGSSNISTARVAAYGLVATFARLIYADPTLDVPAVMNAVIADVSYETVQVERGHLATVHFGVVCDTFTGD